MDQNGSASAVKQNYDMNVMAVIAGLGAAFVVAVISFGLGITGPLGTPLLFILALGFYMMSATRILNEWQRSPILTLGRYSGLYGPGLFFIIPLYQTTPYLYDLRTLSGVFKAEKTLTSDNVTVDVDAIMFYRIENPEKTVLQVAEVVDSVTLAAQTSLRDIIGKVDLTRMIAGRTEIAGEVKNLIDERVLPWGVNVISVEIRDVRIPADLQDAMAKVAVASRERDARVILAESEKLAAQKMVDAANIYSSNTYAMQLRALNMIYEIGISGRNNVIFIPTEAKGLGIPTPVGTFGISDLKEGKFSIDLQKRNGKKSKK